MRRDCRMRFLRGIYSEEKQAERSAMTGNITIYRTAIRMYDAGASEAEQALKTLLDKMPKLLIIDMEETRYISSAGLRFLLSAQKSMKQRSGRMVLRHVAQSVEEIFDVTGFSGVLNIE